MLNKKELTSLVENFSDENSKKVFVFLIEYLIEMRDDILFVKDNVENLQKVTIVNGGGDNVRQTMDTDEFYQLMYNKARQNQIQIELLSKTKEDKGRFKVAVGKVSWWVDNLYRIIVPIAILLGYLGYTYLSKMIERLPPY